MTIILHLEILAKNLMRKAGDMILTPDYTTVEEPAINFLQLDKTIKKSDLLSGLVYAYVKMQLEDADTIRKNTPGVFDVFFSNTQMDEAGEELRVRRPWLFEKK